MRINFDFSDLEAFLAVSDLNSFHRAAEQLNVSQSALTRRIQKLESDLGVTLFERTTRTVTPTLAAKHFRDRARALVDDAVETMLSLRDDTQRFAHLRNEIVTIAAIPTAGHNILPGAIRRFRDAGHKARIRILDHNANDVADAVAEGDADLGISFIPAAEPGLDFRKLASDRFVLVMRNDDPACGAGVIRWADIDTTRLIVPWKGTGNRMLIDNALARSGRVLNWAYEVRRSTTHLDLVEAGIGIAVLPRSALPARLAGDLSFRPLIGPAVTRIIGVIVRAGQDQPRASEAFTEILLKTR